MFEINHLFVVRHFTKFLGFLFCLLYHFIGNMFNMFGKIGQNNHFRLSMLVVFYFNALLDHL